MTTPIFETTTALRQLVRGYIYRCRMSNGAGFEIWTMEQIPRKVAREALLKLANGDYPEKDGVVIYTKADIENLWEARS